LIFWNDCVKFYKERKLEVKIILNGGLKSCCSSYSAEQIYDIVKSWLKESDNLEVTDVTVKDWSFDELSSLAKKYFGERIFPLVYIDEILISIGSIPDATSLNEAGKDPQKFMILKEDILNAARENGIDISEKEGAI